MLIRNISRVFAVTSGIWRVSPCPMRVQTAHKSNSSMRIRVRVEPEERTAGLKLTRYEYQQKAKKMEYRHMSAFKLLQLNELMEDFIQPGMVALDVGAAPGSWCQVLAERLFPHEEEGNSDNKKKVDIRNDEFEDAYILGVDVEKIKPLDHVELLQGDIAEPKTLEEIKKRLNGRRVDLLLSDLATKSLDDVYANHMWSMNKSRLLLELFTASNPEPLLAPDAIFVCRILDGVERGGFLNVLKGRFATVKAFKLDASLDAKLETYVFAGGFGAEADSDEEDY